MKNKFLNAMTLAVILAMVLTSLALADNVQNDVVAGGNDTITVGGSTTINYYIHAIPQDGQTGGGNCNANDGSAATVTINTPAGVTVDTNGLPGNQVTLAFTSCGTNQSAIFASNTAGDYVITVSVSDSGAGTYNTNPATFTLHVNAPVVQNQTINVTTAAPATAVYGSSFGVAATGGGSGNPVVITTSGSCSGGGNGSATITMTSGINTCTVYYNQAGNAGYNAAPQVTSNTTAQKATATIDVEGYSVTYDGAAHTATGTATGVFSEDLSGLFNLSGTPHTNAGTYNGDAWSFAGNDNYNFASGTVDDSIAQAPVTATAGGGTSTYDGSAKSPSACVVSGAYTGNLACANDPASVGPDAGTYAISPDVSGTGLSNFDITSVDGSYTINKAPVTATAGGGTSTYDGSAKSPSACVVSGVYTGDLSCANNPASVGPNAGTTVIAPVVSGTGLSNFDITLANGSYTINKADPTCTVTGYSVYYDGLAHTATGSCKGVLDETLSGLNLSGTTHTLVGAWTDSWTFTDVTGNYNNTNGTVSDAILAWTLNGFFQPVDMNGVWNTVKNGSTVPFKFRVFAGLTELTDISVVKSFSATQELCTGGSEDTIETLSTSGATVLRYDSVAHQFIYNWQTPKKPGYCYVVTMTTQDGSTLVANFKLK